MKIKERSKVVEDRASALVDGGGNWIDCQLYYPRFCLIADSQSLIRK
jgi:hypothetical protein